MRDFTMKTFRALLKSIIEAGYTIQTLEQFLGQPEKKACILRHDVDEFPENALKMAETEHELGIRSTYYFRILKISFNPEIIKKISEFGHEIGYHYEDMSLFGGNPELATNSFKRNLERLREFYPVKTVCMHGSSMSEADNRDIWKYVTLQELNLLGEPYLSIDFSKVAYFSDTARRWNGKKFSIRDQAGNSEHPQFRHTGDIINALQNNQMPQQMMILTHTLWTDSPIEWLKLHLREFFRNNLKYYIVKIPFLRKLAYQRIRKFSS